MLRRVLPAAVLVAVSWISLHGAQQEATPEADAASPTQAGAADAAQAGPADATGTGPPGTDSPGADPPGADAPDSLEGDEAAADVGPPEPPPDILEIGDGLYVLPYCGNAVARVTPHGVVLAGQRLAEYRAEITRLLATVTDRPIAYELATHPGEDADGTPVAPGARRIAPGRTGALASPGGRAEAPDILFSARLSLFLGDAEIALHHVGGGPADGAAVVVFPDRGAVHAGRLVVDGAPFIDFTRGGSAEGWIESLDALLALAFDTVVPGEGGPVLQKSDALAFRDRLVTLRTRVAQLARRRVGKEDVANHLQTADLGWLLGLNADFVRETLPGLYDEVAGGP
ncbi:MAG: hypothetical protein OXF93_24630 [Acidobacteria bacterium]|nr:hypothetical protein [Acidobacteriota bacterium]